MVDPEENAPRKTVSAARRLAKRQSERKRRITISTKIIDAENNPGTSVFRAAKFS